MATSRAGKNGNGGTGGPKGKEQRDCPVCGAPAEADHAPFCSSRCADVDLGRWLRGAYAIPTDEPPDESDSGDGDDEGT
jgi:endogenous inhibitor of DNA gyrase (YacG/DUF329 family)